jgi:nitrite reductase/ring-hydroxylating ferredoxin subunit
MSNKSFSEILNSLKLEGFTFTFFEVKNIGEYFPEDVDWNDKDVQHLNVVHTKVKGIQAVITNKVMSSIYFQTIPFFGIKIPITVNSYEYTKYNIIYFTLYGPFILVVNSISELISSNKTKNIVTFAIGSKKILKIFHPIIKKVLINNNQLLMSEDTPMRKRRGILRKNNHSFFLNSDTYSYSFSTEIYRANIFLKNIDDPIFIINKKELFNAKDQDIVGEKIGIGSFFITAEVNGDRKLWSSICPHEGAELNKKCLKQNVLLCPWHNRKNFPLIKIDNLNKIEIYKNIDFAIKEDATNIKIKYRNKPLYYNKKQYTPLDFNI